MTLELISDRARWDDFVESSSAGLLFHRWDFLKTIEKYSGYKLFPFGIFKGTELIALLPLFFKKANGLKLLYSPPWQKLTYLPYAGLFMGDGFARLNQHKKESYLDIVTRDLDSTQSMFSPDRLTIVLGTSYKDVRSFKMAGYAIEVGYTYVNDLRMPIEKIWEGLHQRSRTSIRSREKRPMSLRECCEPEAFFEIMRNRLSSEGDTFFNVQSPAYLRELMEHFPANVRMWFLYDGDELVDAAVTCEYKDRVMLWMEGSNSEGGNYSEYHYWEQIKDAHRRGFASFEYWGTEYKRLNFFKSKFNPDPVVFFGITKNSLKGSLAYTVYENRSKIPIINVLAKKMI